MVGGYGERDPANARGDPGGVLAVETPGVGIVVRAGAL